MDSEASGNCWHCNQPLQALDYRRESTCPACNRYTHVCKNCRFYTPGRHNDCLEPIAEQVTEKERANFCDYFKPADREAATTTAASAEAQLNAAEDLFK